MSRQKRKDAVEDKIRVSVLAFDLRYLNGESLVTKSFEDMRGMLREYFTPVESAFHFAQHYRKNPEGVGAVNNR